jgi:hypothetical protein
VHARITAAQAGDFTWFEEEIGDLSSMDIASTSHNEVLHRMHQNAHRKGMTRLAASWQHESTDMCGLLFFHLLDSRW